MTFVTALFSLLAWLGLTFFHGLFWVGGPWLKRGAKAKNRRCSLPAVAVVVPARDEAASVTACLSSLLEQDYQGAYHVILVDDESTDGTGDIARRMPDPAGRLTVLSGKPHPEGWSGKLWAVRQGQEEALRRLPQEGYVLLTDADIVHQEDHVSALVERAQSDKFDMVSEMVMLNCASFWEKALVPAFVYFFAMLYPFRKVADPRSPIAGAAGGTVLIRRDMLEKIGGIQSLKGALIDDCTLGTYIKRAGGRLYLGWSEQAWSIRTYQSVGEIWHMIARNAYVQLKFSPWNLLKALSGMVLIWLLPVRLLLFSRGKNRVVGGCAYALSCITFMPTLRWFRLSWWRVLSLPLVAAFYMMATVGSAVNHYRGKGVSWRGRSYEGAES
ncbi:glycosyltransferase [Acetobacteraceae bacterium B3987]|nr:glycosyltransferase [Acetobacteraceae bacterium B3987]